ncbi:MAG: zinc dependent phospholipase C family protein [Niabella sp.]
MMKKSFLGLSGFLLVLVLFISGWGFLVHRTVAQLAIYELPKPMQRFFFANKDSVVYGAPRPDVRRLSDPSEGSKHYLDMEYFGDSAVYRIPHDFDAAIARYSLDTLNKYGTLPFVVMQYLQKLTDAFRSQNADSILFYAEDLSHYIGDAHVPLHTSINYDGQMTGQHGVHDLWETTVPEVDITNFDLSSRHKATYLDDPQSTIWKILEHTHSLVPGLFEKEKEVSAHFNDSTKYRWEVRWGKNRRFYAPAFAKEYSAALKPSINNQLIASANYIADFWYTAWVNAGRPDLNRIVNRPYNQKDFKKERKAFRKNQLIRKHLLISTERMTKD